MKPRKFKQSNATLNRDRTKADTQNQPLEIFHDGKQCISLWSMNWRERLCALFFGRIWLSQHAARAVPAVSLFATRNIFDRRPLSARIALKIWKTQGNWPKGNADDLRPYLSIINYNVNPVMKIGQAWSGMRVLIRWGISSRFIIKAGKITKLTKPDKEGDNKECKCEKQSCKCKKPS